MLELIPYNDPRLLEPTKEFDFANPPCDPVQFTNDMRDALVHYKGLGLSANQVGHSYRMFVAGDPYFKDSILAFFNPVITNYDGSKIIQEEGCLSFPGMLVKKRRHTIIRMRYYNEKGDLKTLSFNGLTARVLQHEYDHIHGKTFLEGCSRLKLEMILKKAKKIGKNYSINELQKISNVRD